MCVCVCVCEGRSLALGKENQLAPTLRRKRDLVKGAQQTADGICLIKGRGDDSASVPQCKRRARRAMPTAKPRQHGLAPMAGGRAFQSAPHPMILPRAGALGPAPSCSSLLAVARHMQRGRRPSAPCAPSSSPQVVGEQFWRMSFPMTQSQNRDPAESIYAQRCSLQGNSLSFPRAAHC
jgi:hypothetical protein